MSSSGLILETRGLERRFGGVLAVAGVDFKLERGAGRFTWKNIGEGDIDWVEVRKAFGEIGYEGYMTTEIEGGDKAYLADVNARLDRFLKGERPVA